MTALELLEKRATAMEQEVAGERAVTRYILEQVRRNGDDLAALRSRVDRQDARLDQIEARLYRIESDIRGLRADLPTMIAVTMREVLAERDART